MTFGITNEPNGTFCDWFSDGFQLIKNEQGNWFASLNESNGSLTSVLQSPTSNDSCLIFRFDVDSETNSQLSVHLQHDNREKSEELLWSLFEVNKNNWDFGRAPLNSADKYRVVFSASSSKHVWIDDIRITQQSDCTVDPPEARPATTRLKNTITYSTATGSTLQDQPSSSRWIVVGVVTVFAVTVSIAVAALVIVFRQRRRNRTPSAGQQPDQMVNRCELPTPNSDHKNEHKTQEGNGSMGLPARGTASASQRLSEQFERDDEGYEAPVSPLALNDYNRDPTFRRDHGPNVKDAAPMINRQMLEPSGKFLKIIFLLRYALYHVRYLLIYHRSTQAFYGIQIMLTTGHIFKI